MPDISNNFNVLFLMCVSLTSLVCTTVTSCQLLVNNGSRFDRVENKILIRGATWFKWNKNKYSSLISWEDKTDVNGATWFKSESDRKNGR